MVYIYIGYITRTISIIFFLHYGLICIVRLQRRVKIYLFFVLKKNLRPPNPPLLTVVASQTHWPRGQMQPRGQIQPHAAGSGWAGRRPQLLFF